MQNEDGIVSTEVRERTYDLKSREQGRIIQLSILASIPLKDFDYNAERTAFSIINRYIRFVDKDIKNVEVVGQ